MLAKGLSVQLYQVARCHGN